MDTTIQGTVEGATCLSGEDSRCRAGASRGGHWHIEVWPLGAERGLGGGIGGDRRKGQGCLAACWVSRWCVVRTKLEDDPFPGGPQGSCASSCLPATCTLRHRLRSCCVRATLGSWGCGRDGTLRGPMTRGGRREEADVCPGLMRAPRGPVL